MKRTLSILISFILITVMLAGCSLLPSFSLGDSARVNFYVGDKLYETVNVKRGETVDMPEPPEKENQVFVGWYTDGLFSTEFDFSDEVYLDINLYAKYVIDAISATNMVNDRAMLSVVTVHNRSFNLALGGLIETDYATVQGSGVVLDISGGFCYVLTNCHVAQLIEGFTNNTLTVEDPWGNEYEASIYKNSKKTDYAISEDFDLALLCFRYDPQDEHRLAEIGVSSDPNAGDYVISIGTPKGKKNTVAFGSVMGYGTVNVENNGSFDKMDFEVIIHNASIEHGSSGGPLLNLNGELVGLNFAGYEIGRQGCAIPMTKINEFLDLYVYAK